MNWGDWGWMPGIELSSAEATFVEVVGIGATVLAAGLAAAAIWQAGNQSERALDNIAHERRLDFELDALKDLYDAVNSYDRPRRAALALSLLPPDGLDLCHAAYWPDYEGPDPLAGLLLEERAVHLLDEVRGAIEVRLNERGELTTEKGKWLPMTAPRRPDRGGDHAKQPSEPEPDDSGASG